LPSAFDVVVPGGLSVTESLYDSGTSGGVRVRVVISWTASQSANVTQYQVETRSGDAGVWIVQGRTAGTSIELSDWPTGIWWFRVKAVSILETSSTFVELRKEIFGRSAPPVAFSGVTLQSAGGLAVLKWPLHDDLDVRIGGTVEIRHSAASAPTWLNSVSMDIVPGSTTIAVVPLRPGAYILRAKDADGNLGPESVISTNGIQALPFVPVTSLTEEPVFSGAKTDCVTIDELLQITSATLIDDWPEIDTVQDFDNVGGRLSQAIYVFAAGMDFGTIRNVRLRPHINMSSFGTLDLIDARIGNIDDWLFFDGPGGGEVDVWVEVRLTNDNPSGSPTWSGWNRIDGSEVRARGVQARAVLTSKDATFSPAISELRLSADAAA
jgi:hypothetical protein